MRYGNGVVVGKFYPPHLGHKGLIDYASAKCDHVTVIIVDRERPGDYTGIPAWLRQQWMYKIHPQRNIIIQIARPPIWFPDIDDTLWAGLTMGLVNGPVDAFFSDEYERDKHFAEIMHANWEYPLEEPRFHASDIRADPMANLDKLHPLVQQFYKEKNNE